MPTSHFLLVLMNYTIRTQNFTVTGLNVPYKLLIWDPRIRASRAVCESRSVWVALPYHAEYVWFRDITRFPRLLVYQQRDETSKVKR